jgi:hypothetical protein
LYFDICFFKKNNVNGESIKLTNDFEMSALKEGCIEKEILNSFCKMLKRPKTMQLRQNNIFFYYLSLCLDCFLKQLKNRGKKSGYDSITHLA